MMKSCLVGTTPPSKTIDDDGDGDEEEEEEDDGEGEEMIARFTCSTNTSTF